jgi:hypothetical protein
MCCEGTSGRVARKLRVMRKRYRVLVFAALVAALIVPVGYALSIDSRTKAPLTGYAAVAPVAAIAVTAPIMMPRPAEAAPGAMIYPTSDSAKLLCIGTILFGLAAAVRKAI